MRSRNGWSRIRKVVAGLRRSSARRSTPGPCWWPGAAPWSGAGSWSPSSAGTRCAAARRRSLLVLVRLLGQRVARAEDQRHAGAFRSMFPMGKLRAWCRVKHVDAGVAAAPLVHGCDRGGIALVVGDPQLEIVILEQLDVGDRRRVMMHPGSLGALWRGRILCPARVQHTGVESRVQWHAGVEYRVGPLGHSGGVRNRGVQQAAGVKLLLDLRRNQVIEPLGVLSQKVDFGRVRAKLAGPFDAGLVADQEPALAVLQP